MSPFVLPASDDSLEISVALHCDQAGERVFGKTPSLRSLMKLL